MPITLDELYGGEAPVEPKVAPPVDLTAGTTQERFAGYSADIRAREPEVKARRIAMLQQELRDNPDDAALQQELSGLQKASPWQTKSPSVPEGFTKKETAPAEPKKRGMSLDELYGIGEPAAGKKKESTILGNYGIADRETVLKRAQNVAAAGDFILGLPAMLVGTAANWGATRQALKKGESVKDAFAMGREANEVVSTPLTGWLEHALVAAFPELKDQSTVTGDVMKKVTSFIENTGDYVEGKTKGGITKEMVQTGFDTAMSGLGVAGLSGARYTGTGMGRRARPGIDAATRRRFEETVGGRPVEGDVLGPEARGGGPGAGAAPIEGSSIRITDPKQLFRTDEEHAAFGEQFGPRPAKPLPALPRPVEDTVSIEDFSREMNAKHPEAPTTFIEHPSGVVEWQGINVPKALRGQGRGEAAISEITRWSDRNERDMMLIAQPEKIAGESPAAFQARLEKLRRWYERHDFEMSPEQPALDSYVMFRDARRVKSEDQNAVRPQGAERDAAARNAAALEEEARSESAQGASGADKALAAGAVGVGAYAALGDDPEWSPAALAIAGGIKAKGGMWHPEAVRRLAGSFGQRLDPVDQPITGWADKAVGRYLNRHAGTADDPLREVVLPSGKSWEEVTDQLITAKKADDYFPITGDPVGSEVAAGRVPRESPVFAIRKTGDTAVQRSGLAEFESYLSHVGDFLRQNVTPGHLGPLEWATEVAPRGDLERLNKQFKKEGGDLDNLASVKAFLEKSGAYQAYRDPLAQYDLVRAVKETAANDARVAKEMEKAAKAQTAQLPVHKEYPDGFKWVELRLPEKLTEEQGKGVERNTVAGVEQKGPGTQYVALDASGKRIVNSYTGNKAMGETPQEAWLAGRLAEEGNQMGHCVGGYCEGVASGESKIYSLRDKEGRSHVTVETGPAGPNRPRQWSSLKDTFLGRHDILQIKGKQNRAPDARYLPYVQDFVKSGKWGEVGDIGNTGLVRYKDQLVDKAAVREEFSRLRPELRGVDRDLVLMNGDIARKLGELDYVEQAYENVAAGRAGRGQEGSADPRLLAALAAAGIGAVVGSQLLGDSQIGGAIKGALIAGSLPFLLPGLKQFAAFAGLPMSQRIAAIHEGTFFRVRELDRHEMRDAAHWGAATMSFLKQMNKLGSAQREAINKAELSGDVQDLQRKMLATNNPDLLNGFMQTRAMLDEVGQKLFDVGAIDELRTDYIPRRVKDREGLLKALRKDDPKLAAELDKRLADAHQADLKKGGEGIGGQGESDIITDFLYRHVSDPGRPGFTRDRRFHKVPEQYQKFYAPMEESLVAYVSEAASLLAKHNFFGKDKVQAESTGRLNILDSIDAKTRRLVDEGEINEAGKVELDKILEARLVPQKSWLPKGAEDVIQGAKNLGYAGLLANLGSAATQLGDVAISGVYKHGMYPTLKAMVKRVTGGMEVSARDLGITNALAEEFRSTGVTAKFLNINFRLSGFNLVDRFIGKDTSLQAGLEKYRSMAQSERGRREMLRVWGPRMGDEVYQMIEDFKSHESGQPRTDSMDAAIFSDLLDTQPVSRTEVPEAYARMPNGRAVYMLHTWQVKQLGMVIQDVYSEMKNGAAGVARGLRNAIRLSAAMMVAGVPVLLIQNWINNKPLDAVTWKDALGNMFKTYGWSQYAMDKVRAGKPVEALTDIAAPPVRMIDDIMSGNPRSWDYIPQLKPFRAHLTDKEEAQKEFNRAQRKKEREMAKERKER